MTRSCCSRSGRPRPPTAEFAHLSDDLLHASILTLYSTATDRPHRFRWQRGADHRLHLMHDGYPVATASHEGDTLPQDLTRLADLRVQPLALAQFLLSVPDEVIKRAGEIAMDLLRDV